MSARTDNRRDGSFIDVDGDKLYVDQRYGDDTRARPHRPDLPYATLAAAKAAAASGEWVIVRPGTYNEANLLKNGVNWYFEPGAQVVYTGAGDLSIFSDGADGANGAVVCKILGHGIFKNQGTIADSAVPNCVFKLTHADTDIYCECLDLECTVDSDTTSEAVLVTAADFTLKARTVTATKDYAFSAGAGAVRLTGRFVSSLTNQPAGNLTGDGVILVGLVELIPHAGASASLNAGSAQNLRVYGTAVTPTALDMDITVTVGAVTVDAQVS